MEKHELETSQVHSSQLGLRVNTTFQAHPLGQGWVPEVGTTVNF